MTFINIMNAWRGAGLIPYNPEHVLGKLPRSIIPLPLDIVTTTPTTTKRIQVASDALLTRVTPSLRAHVELLQTTALNAVADKVILRHTNQELVEKQAQRRQKASRKGCDKARVLTVGEGLAKIEENQQKEEALAREKERYHALNGKVKFAKAVWEEMRIDSDIFCLFWGSKKYHGDVVFLLVEG